MHEIVNTFLLSVERFMPEMYLTQSGFTCSAVNPLLNIKRENKNKKDK